MHLIEKGLESILHIEREFVKLALRKLAKRSALIAKRTTKVDKELLL